MRAVYFAVFFILLAPVASGAVQASASYERLRQRLAPDNDCKALDVDLKAAMAPSLGRNGPIIKPAKLDWILRRLEGLSFVDEDLASLAAKAFAEKPEETYRELRRLSGAECVVEVHRMVKILVNTAAEPGAPAGQQKKIMESIRKWLKAPRPPTMARVLVDFDILDTISRAGLWKFNQDKTRSLEREQSAIASLSREFNKIYYGEEAPKTASFDKADFNKLKPTFVREVNEAATVLSWVRDFIADLP